MKNIIGGSDNPETGQCECLITNGANVTFDYEKTINFTTGFKCDLDRYSEVIKVE